METVDGLMLRAIGVTTVRLHDAVNPPAAATIVVAPSCPAVTTPRLFTPAIGGWAELQAAMEVTSMVDPSARVAIDWNWLLVPAAMEKVDGTTFRATTGRTVRFAVAV